MLTVIKGTVLMTKCPCRHPGDVQKFNAVNVPELHHVVDRIMLSAQGPRPHPNEMAVSPASCLQKAGAIGTQNWKLAEKTG
ncbi:hypothetical protein HPB50_029248 [Hyalomma asiaticum]|nr:hypothetical protein HPB50_029248 [Hyalomma asiaticum]